MAVDYLISIILRLHQNIEYNTSSYEYCTPKLLQNYFGKAFRDLGTMFIVITIRTKFPDII